MRAIAFGEALGRRGVDDRRVTVPLDLLLPFLVASVLVTVIPGADMALITRQVIVGGPALAQRTILGNLTGLLVHGVALAAGLSAARFGDRLHRRQAGRRRLPRLPLVQTLLASRVRRPTQPERDEHHPVVRSSQA